MTKQQIVTKTRAEHAALISAALAKGIESVIEAGQRLAIAQGELTRAEFLAMLRDDLHITEGTASKLKSIASHPVLSELSHGKVLPPNWSVLYALTQVPRARLISAIKDGNIHPDMQRKDVKALLPQPKPEQRDDDLPPDYEGGAPAPDETEPDDESNPITMAWSRADHKARRDFVHTFWSVIEHIHDQVSPAKPSAGNGTDPDASAAIRKAQFAEDADRWIEGDPT
jgi:hypothetical protein